MLRLKVITINLLLNSLFNLSNGDVEISVSDCEAIRYDKIKSKEFSINLIFESTENKLKIILNCTFCDHLIKNRPIKDGKWYVKNELEGQYKIIPKKSELEIIGNNQLKILKYKNDKGFYSCHPDHSEYPRITTLIDSIESDKNRSNYEKFEHEEQFKNHSLITIKQIEEEIQKTNQNFGLKYKLYYEYHMKSVCSKCNRPGQYDQIGTQYLIFKCRFSEIGYLKLNDSKLYQPSVSCNSVLVEKYKKSIFKKLKKIKNYGFKVACNETCNSHLPNLTEISITQKPSVISIFEDESRNFLEDIVLRMTMNLVPNSIKPEQNLTVKKVTYLEEREFKLSCPIDKLIETDLSSIFWYYNYSLISSLKLRVETNSKFS